MQMYNVDRGESQMKPAPGRSCGKPLGILIKAGKHIHPCPVHPNQVIYGKQISC